MSDVALELSETMRAALWAHLLPPDDPREQLAFLFVRAVSPSRLVAVDWSAITPSSFALQLEYHLELGDDARREMIREAHVRGLALAEAHSHRFPARAAFSPSDIAGLKEFVPHVRWRLRDRPYLALVVAPTSYDALVWRADGDPELLTRIDVDGRPFTPTGDSIDLWRTYDHDF